MSTNVFAARRSSFLAQLGEGRVAVVGGKQITLRNGDVDHRFRQSSDLLYLTGFLEPDAIAVFSPGRERPFVLFVQPRDPERETWTGRRAGVEGAVAKFGADAAFSVNELATELPKLLDGARDVMYMHGQDSRMDALLFDAIRTLRQGERRGMRAPSTLSDLRQSLYELRLIKDEDALAKTRRAVEITRDAHVAAMKAARDGVKEYEIEALIDYTFRRNAGVPGYGTICGGGDNATILHYVDNSEALKKGTLLLVDAGCEIDGFTADVTRTYPVGARFTTAQRAIYELVLDTEKRCIDSTKPGTDIEAIHKLAVENLTRGLVEIGLLSGDVAGLIEKGAFRRFYMHRTSHWLGLDVHDVGAYTVDNKPRPLAAGMIFTIEPGLYIPDAAEDLPAEFRGIGVRIEDDILVTATGYENLTRSIPKEVADLEALTAA